VLVIVSGWYIFNSVVSLWLIISLLLANGFVMIVYLFSKIGFVPFVLVLAL
jgi:hypothetical protein